jgi:hypothetical protein
VAVRALRTSVAAGVALAIVAGACGSTSASPGSVATAAQGVKVTSTLDGRSALPHRIHWIAHPGVPAADVTAVSYLIDGKRMWTEKNSPYDYGGDAGSYLVTSFLKPGAHRFTVKILTVNGKTGTDTVTASVPAAPAPPAALAGTWRRFIPQGSAPGSPPSGRWRLVISPVGWQIYDTAGTGDLLDVAYSARSVLVVHTGMVTGRPKYDQNGWCGNAPGPPVRYDWTVRGRQLMLRLAGGHGCDGFNTAIGATWTRMG